MADVFLRKSEENEIMGSSAVRVMLVTDIISPKNLVQFS
jgi:hypothetical protein